MTEESGRIVGRWGTEKVLVRLDSDGRTIDLLTHDELEGDFEVGDPVIAYFDPGGAVTGWILPSRGRGVDLRAPRAGD